MAAAINSSGKPDHMTLLIRMKDGKEYLVPLGNLIHLVEFAKTFGAEIHRVNVGPEVKTTGLCDLPRVMCDSRYELRAAYTEAGRVVPQDAEKTVLHLVQEPRPEIAMSRGMIRSRAENIRKAIRDRFLAGKGVSAKDLHHELGEEVTRAAMTAHVTRVRQELEAEGKKVVKVASGHYVIESPDATWGVVSLNGEHIVLNYVPNYTANTGGNVWSF